MRLATLFLIVLINTQIAAMADGVLEINQTCALNGGCFAGDSAGFPVEITSPGSYRLTSNLNLTSIPSTIAIQIDGPHVTLDLGGFEIAGPVSCTGSGVTLDCGATGSATGIRLNSGADGTSIRNGTIRNMDSSGVGSSGSSRETLENLRAYNNARNGFSVGPSSIISNCIAVENGDNGFDLDIGTVVDRATAEGNGENGFESNQKVVVDNSTTRLNGGRGYDLGPSSRFGDNTGDFNAEPDRCGGGICTQRKRFYVTQTIHMADTALSACADGFHMASFQELVMAGAIQYDDVLGYKGNTAGPGAPIRFGWIRDGINYQGGNTDYCFDWTSTDSSLQGPLLRLPRINAEFINTAEDAEAWRVLGNDCDQENRVWCVED